MRSWYQIEDSKRDKVGQYPSARKYCEAICADNIAVREKFSTRTGLPTNVMRSCKTTPHNLITALLGLQFCRTRTTIMGRSLWRNACDYRRRPCKGPHTTIVNRP